MAVFVIVVALLYFRLLHPALSVLCLSVSDTLNSYKTQRTT